MTFSFSMISRDEGSDQIVRRPRGSDVMGHALRNAFMGTAGFPSDMERLLRKLDGVSGRIV